MLTAEIIKAVAPRARQDYIDALVNGAETFAKYAINTPARLTHFLTQVTHETGGLTIVRENMTYSASRIRAVWPSRPEAVRFAKDPKGLANAVYGSRMGNQRNGTKDDDGYRYRGGSFMQTTGFDNYKRIGDAIGVDLAGNPELIEDATVGLKAACHEFAQYLKYCDLGERGLRAVCNGINRGNPASSLDPIGWSDRQLCFKRCSDAIGASDVAEDTLELGDYGAIVRAVQERLTVLKYPVGKVDGVYGSRTRAAVLAFQAENGLTTDGRIGAQTRAALNSEVGKPMPVGDRATEGKEELKAAGSVTLQTTDAVKSTVKAVGTAATTFAVADQTGLLSTGAKLLTDLQQYKGVASGMAEILSWSLAHWYYFVPLGCYLIYRWAKAIEIQRILKHQLGLDLSL